MKLSAFIWACLLIAALAFGYQVFSGPAQDREAISLFTSTMILMSIGFRLVQVELSKLRPK